MITSTKGPGGTASFYQAPPLTASAKRPINPQNTDAHFDQLQLSNVSAGQSFQKELVAKLVGEVRTAHTMGDIQSVKQEIQNGSYRIDPVEIANKMLLEGSFHGIG